MPTESVSGQLGTSTFRCVTCGLEKRIGRPADDHRRSPTRYEIVAPNRDTNADLFGIEVPDMSCDAQLVRGIMEA